MNKYSKIILPVLIIIIAAILRVFPHMPNFAPISAMALFGGVYLGKKYALIIPLLAMLLSDYLLLYIHPYSLNLFYLDHLYPTQSAFHHTTVAVYSSFIISGLLGIWLRNHKSIIYIFLTCLLSSVQFFLITNAAVWFTGMYDRSILGLWESYIAGVPFFRATVFGDLFYTTLFFGSYEAVFRLMKTHKFVYV